MPAYTAALCREMADAAPRLSGYLADTVYLGGGTPSLLPGGCLSQIFEAIHACCPVAPGAEITCEANPKTIDYEKFCLLKKLGVNRVSIGVQSMVDNELRLLGRIHTAHDARTAVESARRAGIENISLDLMTGIPAQTAESLTYTVREAAALAPTHISAYALRIEDGTPFARRRRALPLPDEDGEATLMQHAAEALEAAGYARYEISNYARPGYESRHNLRYWHGEEYLGFGVAAYSCFGGRRFGHSRDLESYLAGAVLPEVDCEVLTPREEEREFLMLRLRLTEGIPVADYNRRFGRDFDMLYAAPLLRFADFLREGGGRVALHPRGMMVSNSLIVEFLSVLDGAAAGAVSSGVTMPAGG